MLSHNTSILTHTLSNGLVILIRPTHIVPKVSIQLWYNIGSKDEKLNQKGIAHLIEHMIFKGTKTLSESDINLITHKLSGYCNAFTSHDYTGYLFDFPSQHWQEALPIMADCMRNCTFKEELLNSEMKAVIQELKMYKDDYISSIIEELMAAIFTGHPYHYPIIGFKHDLWSMKREQLITFYNQYYVPNNATLVIVGDVDPDYALQRAKTHFNPIQAQSDCKKEKFYLHQDIIQKHVTLYRDVQQPLIMCTFLIPGQRKKNEYVYDILAWLLGLGKASRLYQKLINELQLATEVEVFTYDLFDYGLFFIYIRPNTLDDASQIISCIEQEINDLYKNGITNKELERAKKQAKTNFLANLENTEKQAYIIGQAYTAKKDAAFIDTYGETSDKIVVEEIKDIIHMYLRPSLMHTGYVRSLYPSDCDLWQKLQKKSDAEDARVLSRITRKAHVEEGTHVHTIHTKLPKPFKYPKAERVTLSNGLTVLYYHNPTIEKIQLLLDLPAKYYHDPENLQGLNLCMSALLTEGTKKYSASDLAQEIEGYGMSFSAAPGLIQMNMLSNDFVHGLKILNNILTQSIFELSSIEKVRRKMHAALKNYWDTPIEFVEQLARDHVYKKHPYSKKILGDPKSIDTITRNDILHAYHTNITPVNSILVISGNIETYNVKAILEEQLSSWHGNEVEPLTFPPLQELSFEAFNYPINRDQAVLCYAGTSISRLDLLYDPVMLFNQIFTGGVLGSMSSRLFQLREQSGLFYTIGGSLLSHADHQPGMIYLRTIVSLDRLQEAEKTIEATINFATQAILPHELEQAQNAITNNLANNFESNNQIAASLLFKEKFNLPDDYFDNRAAQLKLISIGQIKSAVDTILTTQKLIKIRIGRL